MIKTNVLKWYRGILFMFWPIYIHIRSRGDGDRVVVERTHFLWKPIQYKHFFRQQPKYTILS